MKGNNTMILNEATMMEAVQEYLDRRWPNGAPQVVSFRAKTDSFTHRTFEVVVSENTVEREVAES